MTYCAQVEGQTGIRVHPSETQYSGCSYNWPGNSGKPEGEDGAYEGRRGVAGNDCSAAS